MQSWCRYRNMSVRNNTLRLRNSTCVDNSSTDLIVLLTNHSFLSWRCFNKVHFSIDPIIYLPLFSNPPLSESEKLNQSNIVRDNIIMLS